jgi:hypothetical protein
VANTHKQTATRDIPLTHTQTGRKTKESKMIIYPPYSDARIDHPGKTLRCMVGGGGG